MQRVILLHFGELALKGKNRAAFEKKLEANLRIALADFDLKLTRQFGAIEIAAATGGSFRDEQKIETVLKSVFGVALFYFAYKIDGGYDAIEKTALELLEQEDFNSFAVKTKRSDKKFPLSSVEVDRQLGAAVVKQFNKKVNLKEPDLTLRVRISDLGNYIYYKKISGAGGLPVSSGGKMLSLLSSGIDSPVASYRMMKRGATIWYLHFHSYPMTTQASIDNAKELVETLQKYQPPSRLFLAPLAELQKNIAANTPPKFRIILYRRAMLQIAEKIARKHKVKALITGESLGQVASQTLQNMSVTSAGISLPIFRPLIGMDKQEIIDQAAAINTFEISTRPYEDCCTLLVPKSVETHAKLAVIQKIENQLPWQELLQSTISGIEELNY